MRTRIRQPDRSAASALATICLALAAATALRAEIPVVVRTVEPDPVEGSLTSFSLSKGAELRQGTDARLIASGDIICIDVRDRSTNATATEVRVSDRRNDDLTLILADGGLLIGRVLEGGEGGILLETPDVGRLPLSLDGIARVTTSQAALPAFRQTLEWFERSRSTNEDRVLLTNGDVVRGFVTALDRDGVTIDTGAGRPKLPFRLVVAVRLAAAASVAPAGAHAVVSFRDGTKVIVKALEWTADAAEAMLADGVGVRIVPDRIVRVEVAGGRWEWLSVQPPVSYAHTPMLSLDWDFVPDRNVFGNPLGVAGHRFERGIGVHSRSVLVFELKGGYQEFVTSFGMDDDTGPSADVTVAILVDGQKRFTKTGVRPGTLHGPVRLDVARANRIELVTDFGDNGDIQDRFDWIESGLIRP